MIPIIYRAEGLYHARFAEHPKTFRDRSLERLLVRLGKWLEDFERVQLELVHEEVA